MKTEAAILLLAALCSAAPVLAQTAPGGEPAPGRYQFQPVEGGLAKLDTATGEITICRVDPARMVCDPDAAPRGPVAVSPSGPSSGSVVPPPPVAGREDEEFDKALDRMKRVFRAFGDVAREFEGAEPAPSSPEPNRT
ncbi:hypothetical protein ASG43_02605 [Aureimonas sp. Leaf454]|uniref:hypothetical protein n=1 Tax=Aureimonas sp. Leaf454 TaxID=1736381 RepID=UPI0006F20243|nr:hypothetical protein [Aureimonas sp. Leaf454]KQT54502.1 hypothetical protein ASG43_02605 [Aureimonas sp. Leaf454]